MIQRCGNNSSSSSKVSYGSSSSLVAPHQQSVSARGVMSRRQAGGDEIDAMCCVGALQ